MTRLNSSRYCGLPARGGQDRRATIQALKFAAVSQDQVLAQVRDLNQGGRGPSTRILSWLNRHVKQLRTDSIEALRKLKLFEGSSQQFVTPRVLFRHPPELGRWRFALSDGDQRAYPALLDALDVEERPQVADFQAVLREIAQQYGDGQQPDKDDVTVAQHCLRSLTEMYSRFTTPEERAALVHPLQTCRSRSRPRTHRRLAYVRAERPVPRRSS
ncbi:hypothetical protein HNR42_002855 [Deinobacterium chartae]|uniref:Uncharacterized protein n=1 Tax=Deinobacterium chartae TaxID=521158 RepID=A0A841I314_9DEIO|nr:hypothetical protein [Deinobacterium chartae]